MSNFTVVLDACVLVPMHLRNLLMWMAYSGLFRAKWSNQIHAEWMRNVLRIRRKKGLNEVQIQLLETQLERTRIDMDNAIPNSLVTGFELIAESLIGINNRFFNGFSTGSSSYAKILTTCSMT